MKMINSLLILLTMTLVACGGGGGGGETTPPPPPAVTLDSIDVTPTSATIPSGLSQSFSATGNYSDGTSEDITSSVTWSSTATGFASVDSAGLVTGVSPGTASIQADLDGKTGAAAVTISNATLSQITLDPGDPEIPVGLSRKFKATGHFSDGSAQPLTALAWDSSDTSVAIINTNGRITAVGSGSSDITATYAAASGDITGQTTLRVTENMLLDIVVSANDGSSEIPVNATQQYTAMGIYDSGPDRDITSDVTWLSSVPAVASINSSGLATGLSAGDTTISASLTIDSTTINSNNVMLTVSAIPFVAIDIRPDNDPITNFVFVGVDQEPYQAIGILADGTEKDVTNYPQTTWTSSNPNVATVRNGKVTGKSGHGGETAEITATNRDKTDTITVTVFELGIDHISISPANAFIRYDDTQAFSVTVFYLDGTSTELGTSGVTWSISDPSIASVGANGVVTALGIGNATLTAEYGGQSAQLAIHGVGKSPVLQTGQTLCYNASNTAIACDSSTLGQDGALTSGLSVDAARWTVDGDCVTDNVTGLMWLKPIKLNNGAGLATTWSNAISTVESASFCNENDWRLPNVNEMRSLVNYGETSPYTYLLNQGFEGANATLLAWTSTNHLPDPTQAIVIDLTNGVEKTFAKTTDNIIWAWAVRSINGGNSSLLPRTGQQVEQCYTDAGVATVCTTQDAGHNAGVSWPSPRFEVTGDGSCVIDYLTGLTWMMTPDQNLRNWQDALAYANQPSLMLCGQSNWRLPSVTELQSLMHEGFGFLDIVSVADYLNGEPFVDITNESYWTSTTYVDDPTRAWTVDFNGSGTNFNDPKTNVYKTWLVRGRRVFE